MTIMTQVSATSPGYGHSNRYIDKIENFNIVGSVTWRVNNWAADSLFLSCGIGIASWFDGLDINVPSFNCASPAMGAWACLTHSSSLPYAWIGYNGYSPLATSDPIPGTTIIDGFEYNNAHTTNIWIHVGPNLGANNYNVSVRLQCGAFDETRDEDRIFTDGHALLMISGNFVIAAENYNELSVPSLEIQEQP